MFDPFGIHNQINAMMGNFMADPFAPPGANPRANNSNPNVRGANNQVAMRNSFDPFGSMFASPFDRHNSLMSRQQSMMNNPFALMNQMMGNFGSMDANVIHADPSAQVFSSSSVMTYSNANGKPKVYQQTTQVQQGPGGVRETRKLVRDSEKGIEQLSVGHHIGDRAHVIERQKTKDGAIEEVVNLENLDDEEVGEFNKEFENKIRQSHIGNPNHHRSHHQHHINAHQQQPFAIEDAPANAKNSRDRKSKSKSKH